MTEQQALDAYQQKYAAFPDLVARVQLQFDYAFWQTNNPEEQINVSRVGNPDAMAEDKRFWVIMADTERVRELQRGDIDFLYRVFNIEQ